MLSEGPGCTFPQHISYTCSHLSSFFSQTAGTFLYCSLWHPLTHAPSSFSDNVLARPLLSQTLRMDFHWNINKSYIWSKLVWEYTPALPLMSCATMTGGLDFLSCNVGTKNIFIVWFFWGSQGIVNMACLVCVWSPLLCGNSPKSMLQQCFSNLHAHSIPVRLLFEKKNADSNWVELGGPEILYFWRVPK